MRDAEEKPNVAGITRHGGTNYKSVPGIHGCMGCDATGFSVLCDKCRVGHIFQEVTS